MTEKTLTTENIKPAIDALRGELAPWPVVAMKQDRLNDTQKSAVNSGITSGLVAQIIANTAAIRALESAITGTGLRPLVVASLPAIGTQGILYIVPVTTYDPATDADVVNYSNEYIWIVAPDAPVTEGYYEQVGQTGIVINNGQLNITVNGTSVGTFTANQSGDTTAAITVPTNADYVDRTTAQTVAGVKTFSDGIVSNVTGTASRAIADEDGNSIKTSYGKLANVNTWATPQIFSSVLRFNNDSYVSGTPSENIFYTALQWGGYINNTWTAPFTINNAVRTTGYSDTSFRIYSQTSNTLTGFVHETNADASDIAFRPIANATHKLGNASYQWSAVYAKTYYYNGTVWGLDKVNVWTNSNTFNQSVTIAGQSGILWDRKAYTAGTLPASTLYYGFQNAYESGGSVFDRIRSYVSTTGTNLSEHVKYAWNDLTKYASVTFWISAGGSDSEYKYNTSRVIPATTNTTNLGTSTNKWKTLNGVNPGGLSFPNLDAAVTIDTTGWSVTVASTNTYTPAVDGWLAIDIKDTATSSVFIYAKGLTGIKQYSASVYGNGSQGTGRLALMVPAFANVQYAFIIKADSLSDISYVRFYPCLGSV